LLKEEVGSTDNIEFVQLDVTKSDSIAAAVKQVEKSVDAKVCARVRADVWVGGYLGGRVQVYVRG